MMKKHVVLIPTSFGELVDKITILEIKEQNIVDKNKLRNIRKELSLLNKIFEQITNVEILSGIKDTLSDINKSLWEIEDQLREKEKKQDFSEEFINLARSVYVMNDKRYEIKNRINTLLGSQIVEEKSYSNYKKANKNEKE